MKYNIFKKIINFLYKALVAQFIVFGSLFGAPPNLKEKPSDKKIERKKDDR